MRFLFPICLLLCLAAGSVCAMPDFEPRLEFQTAFDRNAACPVFRPDTEVKLHIRIKGARSQADVLEYVVADYRNTPVASGTVDVPAGNRFFNTAITLPSDRSGYFQIHLKLRRSGLELQRNGSRPAGVLSYAVLPKMELPKLAHPDDSRFGAQGTFTPKVNPGDDFGNLYDLVGMKWIYLPRRLFDIGGKTPEEFDPESDYPPWENYKDTAEAAAKAQLAVFSDIHSVPLWLMKAPEGVDLTELPPSAGHSFQSHPPRDFKVYQELISRVVRQQAELRKREFPAQSRGYYEIHWEPDWHWKGTDAEFIAMYKAAQAGIRAADPDARLLGANYGVLKTGNDHLERLFQQGLGEYLDDIVTHLYYLPMSQSPEEAGVIEEMRRLDAMRRKYLKKDARIINSEWGVQCSTAFGKTALQDPGILLREAAWFLRGHLIALGEGAQTTFFFYTVDHGEWGLFYNLDPMTGYLPQRVAPKPLFSAVAAMTRLLEGSVNLGRIDYLGSRVWGYLFRRQDSAAVAALWCPDEQTRTISVPVGTKTVELYDPMGNLTLLESKEGFVEIEVGPNPVFLKGLSPAAVPSRSAASALCPTIPGKTAGSEEYRLFAGGKIVPAVRNGRLELPAEASAGTALLLQLDADGNWKSSERIEILPKTGISLTDAGESGFALELREMTRRANTVSCEIRDDSGNRIAVADSVKLGAAETKQITLKPDRQPESNDARIVLTAICRDRDGAESSAVLELPNRYPVGRAAATPVIDGSLDEWNFEKFHTLNTEEAVKIGRGSWNGAGDLSYRFAVEYDDDALYFAFRVRDDNFRQTRDALDAWAEDSIQIGLGVKPNGDSWEIYTKLCFAVNSETGEMLLYRHNGTGKECPPGNLAGRAIRFGFRRTGDESCYEMAIPWREIDSRLTAAPVERKIGIGLLVNDVDTTPAGISPRKAMEMFGGMAEGNPAKMGTAGWERQ